MILEFKVIDPETEKSLEDTVRAALSQIVRKNYAAVLGKNAAGRKSGFMVLRSGEKRYLLMGDIWGKKKGNYRKERNALKNKQDETASCFTCYK